MFVEAQVAASRPALVLAEILELLVAARAHELLPGTDLPIRLINLLLRSLRGVVAAIAIAYCRHTCGHPEER